MIRKWDITNEEIKKQCIRDLLTRIDEQEYAEFGNIAAQDIVEIVAKYVGPQFYNSGLEDAKKVIHAKLADLEIDIDILSVSK